LFRRRSSLLFLLVPLVFYVVALPFVNRIEPLVFEMPFFTFWMLVSVVVTPVSIWLAAHFDPLYGGAGQVGANQRVGVAEAIRMFTANGAHATFEENIKGSIEAGKLADLVVLDGPILSVESDRIKDLQVETTIIDGEIVYRRSPTPAGQRAR
jgi:cytosine/adenosine deaminase-related metal-dependent hydrolase